jgi:CarD-like/TRCF RID domain
MNFQVGDTVIHWSYGLGQITGMEERSLTGTSQLYYVLRTTELSIWAPGWQIGEGMAALAQFSSRVQEAAGGAGRLG